MARKRGGYALPDVNGQFDSLFSAVTDVAREKFPGHDIYSGDAEAMRIVCLPVPAFSVRFMLQQEGLPMGRFLHIAGVQETCKSAFGFEVLRWHGQVPGGGGILVPTEPKDAPELFRSIIGYNHPRMRYHDKCRTTQEWNAATKLWVTTFKKLMDGTKKEPGPGRKAPIGIMVDSICANLTDEEYGQLQEHGFSEKHFGNNAALLKDWLMYITQEIEDWPFTLIGINHQRDGKERVGMFERKVRNVTGGAAPRFFETTHIEMQRLSHTAPGKEVDHKETDEKGIELLISVHKNSMAPHEKVKVEMLWYTDYDDRDPAGHFRQKTYFDWHAASIDILVGLLRGDGKRAKRLREVLDLTLDGDTKKVYSPTLGIPQKERVKPREAGAILEQKLKDDVDFRNALYAETGVRRRYLFCPDLDYREQIKEAVKMASVAEKKVAQVESPFINPEGANGDGQ
jgi:hypothetical protein